jgi:hypothetical protein
MKMIKIKFCLFVLFCSSQALAFNPQNIKSEFKECLNYSNGEGHEAIKNCLIISFNGVANNVALQYCAGSSRSSLISEIERSKFNSIQIAAGFDHFCKKRRSETNRD